jgi:hypothetical protein
MAGPDPGAYQDHLWAGWCLLADLDAGDPED